MHAHLRRPASRIRPRISLRALVRSCATSGRDAARTRAIRVPSEIAGVYADASRRRFSLLAADHLELAGTNRRQRFLSHRHQRPQCFKTIVYSLDNQNCQRQGIDALLELQIPIDGKETVKLSGGPL